MLMTHDFAQRRKTLQDIVCHCCLKDFWGIVYYGLIILALTGLVLRSQEVIDRLDRSKCADRHFYKYCIPIVHCPVPQTRPFKGEQFTSVFALFGYEGRFGINERFEVELFPFVVAQRANQIHRIEIGALFEHSSLLGIGHIYLSTFQYLQGRTAVCFANDKRPPTGFTLIAHHTADTYRTV
uniref:ORF2 n=1 Tax=Porphyromonas gingivalis TaxID=837 RepID=Q9ZAD5_PORGN|nr:ORF2 [Porphyromonas gingivalis] [Porphyromonas gingivalis ATCC 33277]